LDEVEGLGGGEAIRGGGEAARTEEDAQFTEGRGDDVSTAFGDAGVDIVENALDWEPAGFSGILVKFEVVEVKDESRPKLGLVSKVAKASSNEVGLTGPTCVVVPLVVGDEAFSC